MNDRQLTQKALGVAQTLTYNEAAAKNILHELAHRLDTRSLEIRTTYHGTFVRDGHYRERRLTFREWLAWRLCKCIPQKV